MNKRISVDGSVVFWSSKRCQRSAVVDSFNKIGLPSVVPSIDHFDSLKETAKTLCETCGLVERGVPMRYESLGSDLCGLEVRRKRHGKVRNDYEFLFSIGLVGSADDPEVDILESEAAANEVHTARKETVEAANALYAQNISMIPAKDLTEALVALVKRSNGINLKETGGVYYIPAEHLDPYVSVSGDLQPHGPNLVTAVMDVSNNPELFRQVNDSVNDWADKVISDMHASLADLQQRGGKTRRNGQSTRLNDLAEIEKVARFYQQHLKVSFKKVLGAVEAARAMLGAKALKEGL